MPVPVRPGSFSRSSPYPTRWRKAKKNRQPPALTTEDKRPSCRNKPFKPDLPDIAKITPCLKSLMTMPAVDAPAKFGDFGGQFAPELQMDILLDLLPEFNRILSDDAFWTDFFACPLTRPSPLHLAQNLTQAVGGANVWLKREDLSPFGSYLARTIVGQILFARRIGKTEIVMECGFAGHGLVCVTMCARVKMKCTIFMGASDVQTQAKAVRKMRQLGAAVISAKSTGGNAETGTETGTLREAINEAIRYSMTCLDSTYHIASGTVGPHPIPSITRTFQSLLGLEIRNAFERVPGNTRKSANIEPAAIISHTGSSCAAALGLFTPFISSTDTTPKLVAVEAATAAPLTYGSVGVMYGCKTLVLQDDNGQILPSHAMNRAQDMSFPCAGPEMAYWKDSERLWSVAVEEEDALKGLDILFEYEGVKAGMTTGYAVLEALRVAKELGRGRDVVVLVSG
ncbi:tryptophan synthase beta subunit-like PLP-dependent enzyme [Aspergillus unguis]